jgi:hypothetical protein
MECYSSQESFRSECFGGCEWLPMIARQRDGCTPGITIWGELGRGILTMGEAAEISTLSIDSHSCERFGSTRGKVFRGCRTTRLDYVA